MSANACFQSSSSNIAPPIQYVLLIDFISLKQDVIDHARTHRSRLHDFYFNAIGLSARIPLFRYIAEAVNATPISDDKVTINCPPSMKKTIPTLHFYVRLHKLLELHKSIVSIHGSVDKPIIIQRYTMAFSCMYCSRIQTNLDSWSPFILFQETAATSVWVFMLLLIIFVIFVVCKASGNSASSVALIALSALISAGVSFGNENL